MVRSKCRPRSEWRTILEDLEKSSLTQKEYAKQIGCHPFIFAWWLKRLREIDAKGCKGAEPPSFVEVLPADGTGVEPLPSVDSPVVQLQGRRGTLISFSTLPPPEYLLHILREG